MRVHLSESSVLETERLFLKEINAEIWNHIFTHLTDAEIMFVLALTDEDALEIEKYKFKNGMTTYRINFKLFLMIEKETGNTIGKIGYHNWFAMFYRSEIGYAMDVETAKQKGYMKEAMKPILEFGFHQMN